MIGSIVGVVLGFIHCRSRRNGFCWVRCSRRGCAQFVADRREWFSQVSPKCGLKTSVRSVRLYLTVFLKCFFRVHPVYAGVRRRRAYIVGRCWSCGCKAAVANAVTQMVGIKVRGRSLSGLHRKVFKVLLVFWFAAGRCVVSLILRKCSSVDA